MKIVLDTNVLISGIFWTGAPRRIINAFNEKRINIVYSAEILAEYVATVDLLAKRYPHVDAVAVVQRITAQALPQMPRPLLAQVSRDFKDDMFIACALGGNIKILVSGDKDLLVLGVYEEVEVIAPAHFVRRFLD